MNKIFVVGNVTRDPELREVNGVTCLNFSLASDSRTKGTDGKYITNFYSCTAWRGLADSMSKYIKKGMKFAVSGDLTIRTYVDNNGQNRTMVQVTVSDIDFASTRNSNSDNANQNNNSSNAQNNVGLPF